MPREDIQIKRNTQPDDDIGDCPAVSPEGYLCTKNRLHYGNHDAKGINNDSKMNWSDSVSVPDPNPRKDLTPRQ